MVFLITIFVLMLSGSVWGQIKPGSISVSGNAGGFSFDFIEDRNQDMEDGLTYGGSVGYNFTENVGLEVSANYIDTESEHYSGDDAEGFLYRLEGLYHLMPQSRFVPYLALGVGHFLLRNDEDNPLPNYRTQVGDYGLGVKLFITQNIALRADARHVWCFNDSYQDLLYTGGISFQFGGKDKVKRLKDSDGDGVHDGIDQCPGTPAGVPVDSVGCPLDSDGDGVHDGIDECPGTPPGTPVDEVGCPLAEEGEISAPTTTTPVEPETPVTPTDEYEPSEPETVTQPMTGIWMSDEGCPVIVNNDGSVEMTVLFEFDKANVTNYYRNCVEKVAAFMKAYPGVTAQIEGHTDYIGTEEYNMKLSKRRAEAVKRVLSDFGVETTRLQTYWYGETQPISDNTTAKGRQLNRRAITITTTPLQ